MQQAFLECPVVERKDVGHHLAARLLVDVLERPEELARRLAVELGELRREVRTHVADRRVHGVIARAGVHRPPLDLLFKHPVQGVEIGPGVVAEVFDQVLLRPPLVVAMPSGVQDQDIVGADVGVGALDDVRRDHRPVAHPWRDVHHHAAVDEVIQRQRRHIAFAIVGRVHGAVEMGADMQRGVDALRHDHLGLQVLRVVHLVARIADPAGGVNVHHMGHIDDFHAATFLVFANRSPDRA